MHSAPVTVMGPSAISAAVASSITMRWSPRASAVKPPRRRTGPVTVSVSPSGLTSVFAPSRPSSSCVARRPVALLQARRLSTRQGGDAARLGAGQCQNGRKIGNVGAVDAGRASARACDGWRRTTRRASDGCAGPSPPAHPRCARRPAGRRGAGWQHHAAAHGVHAQKHRRLRPVARYSDAFRRGRAGGREAEYAFLTLREGNPEALHQAKRHIQIGPADDGAGYGERGGAQACHPG